MSLNNGEAKSMNVFTTASNGQTANSNVISQAEKDTLAAAWLAERNADYAARDPLRFVVLTRD